MSPRRAIKSTHGSRRRRAAELRVESMEARQLLATFTVNSTVDTFSSPSQRFDPAFQYPIAEAIQALTGSTTGFRISVVPGDFTGDGTGDFAVTINNTDRRLIQSYVLAGPINPANPQFFPIFSLPMGQGNAARNAVFSAAGDYNGDGRVDLAYSLSALGDPSAFSSAVQVLTNPGTPGAAFTATPQLNVSGAIANLAAGDINGDGFDDLAIQIRNNSIDSVAIYRSSPQAGSVQFVPGAIYTGTANGLPADSSITGVALGRFSPTGSFDNLDLAIAYNTGGSTGSTGINIYRNLGSGELSISPGSPVTFGRESVGLAVGDFNADGISDLVVIGSDGPEQGRNPLVRLSDEFTGGYLPAFALPVTPFGDFDPELVLVGDINNDGAPDIIPGYEEALFFIGSRTTLRDAISRSNILPDADTINFRILPNSPDGSVPTIQVGDLPLPAITAPVTIDGYSQPGASPNTLATGNDATLRIRLDGGAGGTNNDGLAIDSTTAGGTTIQGLIITRFFNGINVYSSDGGVDTFAVGDGVTIAGNFIGVDAAGTSAQGNRNHGIQVSLSPTGVVVGGTTPASRNLISGNDNSGVLITKATGNTVSGNYIGTDRDGRAAIGNEHGVRVGQGGIGNTIDGNLISGNRSNGILISGQGAGEFAASNQTIVNNRIGVNATGQEALRNGGDGISIQDYGLANSITNNLISGNGGNGVSIAGGTSGNNTLAGNRIGTSLDGTTAIGNFLDGVQISDSPGNIIGGSVSGAGNLISGNGTNGEGAGINLFGANARANRIEGNLIGTDLNGTADVGNTLIGVFVGTGAAGTVIAGNVISGNGTGENQGVGVYLYQSSGTTIVGNKIGTTADGSAILPGTPSAIGVLANDSSDNIIGGSTDAERNVISGHGQIGVYLARETSGDQPTGRGSTGNTVQNNFIGTDFAGLVALPNGADGVNISNSPDNRVINNLISGNLSTGIQLFGPSTTGNTVANNRIGLNANNAPTLPNGNRFQEGGGVGIFNNTGGTANTIANNLGVQAIVNGSGVAPAASAGSGPITATVTKVTGKGKKGARQTEAARNRKAKQAKARHAANHAARAKAHKVKVAKAHPRGPARDAR